MRKQFAGKGFEIVGRADVSGDLNEAREAANKIFAENKDVTAVMCGNDQIALGALVAARTAGLTDVKIYGVDGSPRFEKRTSEDGFPDSRNKCAITDQTRKRIGQNRFCYFKRG